MNDHDNKYYLKNITRIGKFLWLSGGCSLYKNGDGTGCILHWWHPLGALLGGLQIVLTFFVEGVSGVKSYGNPFRKSKWFRDNPSRYEVVPRRGNWRE